MTPRQRPSRDDAMGVGTRIVSTGAAVPSLEHARASRLCQARHTANGKVNFAIALARKEPAAMTTVADDAGDDSPATWLEFAKTVFQEGSTHLALHQLDSLDPVHPDDHRDRCHDHVHGDHDARHPRRVKVSAP